MRSKPLNPMITAVILSRVFCSTQEISMLSTEAPQRSCKLWSVLFNAFYNMQRITSLLSSFSKTPSHPIIMKSYLSWILNTLISGVGITMLARPPYLKSFASMSPIVRETESLPGSTRKGPVRV